MAYVDNRRLKGGVDRVVGGEEGCKNDVICHYLDDCDD